MEIVSPHAGVEIRHRPHHRAVDRVAAILDVVAGEPDGVRLTEIAVKMDAPLASVQKLIDGLVVVGYLVEHSRRYQIGPAPRILALRIGQRPLSTVSHADLLALHCQTDMTVAMAVRSGDHSVFIDYCGRELIQQFLSTTNTRLPLTHTMIGRVLLAQLSDRDRRHCIATCHSHDPDTTAGVDTMLDRIRAEGYGAGDSGPVLRGFSSIAAPVIEHGTVAAAVAIVGRSEEIAGHVPKLANILLDATTTWATRPH